MRFTISKVILWSKKEEFEPRVLPFEMQAVNIITGASRTGKSSLIPIIDYCLGSEKCAIPVDIIRNACSWFGVLFDLDNEQLLLCRREPGNQASTADMFVLRGKEITIPKTLTKNTSLEIIKDKLNEEFGISFLELEPEAGVFRPSYRDFMAFLFQPQNIVANADVLFYKADTMEHRKKLIDVFPYALGAVTGETLAKRKKIERLTKVSERYLRDLNQIKTVAASWKQEVAGWLAQAYEYGLTNYQANGTDDFELQINELRVISKKRISDINIKPNQINYNSEKMVELYEEERQISSELFSASKRFTEMTQLVKSIDEYNKSLQIQQNRLEISNWLRSRFKEKSVVPLFQPSRKNAAEDLNMLYEAIKQIEQTTSGMAKMPAAFDRELQIVQDHIKVLSEKLEAIQKNIQDETQKQSVPSEERYTMESVSRFLGRMETAIATYENIGKDSELQKKFEEINAHITQLKGEVQESEIRGKQQNILKSLSLEMGKILAQLDVEHPEDAAELVIDDLTIRVKNSSGRNDYLWEIGSASNWLSYHIALILALQYHLQTNLPVKVPNIIIFDQPSQVYFPRARNPNEIEQQLRDDDKIAVRKIFEALSNFVKDARFGIQIIVTEHADEDVWGNITDTRIHLVERWREDKTLGENKKLVPIEWIK